MKIRKFLEVSPLFAIQDGLQSFNGFLLPHFRREGVNLMQGLILISLLFEQEKTIHPGLLVQVFKTSKSSIGQAISALEKKGLARRELNDEDARSYRLLLSEKGMKSANRLSSILDLVQQKIEKGIGEARLQAVILGLQDIQKAIVN